MVLQSVVSEHVSPGGSNFHKEAFNAFVYPKPRSQRTERQERKTGAKKPKSMPVPCDFVALCRSVATIPQLIVDIGSSPSGRCGKKVDNSDAKSTVSATASVVPARKRAVDDSDAKSVISVAASAVSAETSGVASTISAVGRSSFEGNFHQESFNSFVYSKRGARRTERREHRASARHSFAQHGSKPRSASMPSTFKALLDYTLPRLISEITDSFPSGKRGEKASDDSDVKSGVSVAVSTSFHSSSTIPAAVSSGFLFDDAKPAAPKLIASPKVFEDHVQALATLQPGDLQAICGVPMRRAATLILAARMWPLQHSAVGKTKFCQRANIMPVLKDEEFRVAAVSDGADPERKAAGEDGQPEDPTARADADSDLTAEKHAQPVK